MNEQFLAYLRMEKQNTIQRYRQMNLFAQKGQILFAGSSLAEQFPLDELLKSQDYNNLPSGTTIYNRGVGSFVIDELLTNMQTLILELEPSKLFINIGTNDTGLIDYKQTTLMNKYQEVLDIVKRSLPNCQVYILSYYPVNLNKVSFIPEKEKPYVFGSRNNLTITKANEGLTALANKNHATYIDVSSCLMDDTGTLNEAYTVEGIHLWPNAYKKVLDVLIPYFNKSE